MSYSKYIAIAKTETYSTMAYFYEIIAHSVFIVLILFIFYNLWKAIYSAESVTSVSGLSLLALIWYLALSESTVAGSRVKSISWQIEQDVKSGNIAYSLNKPYHFMAYYFSATFFSSLIRIAIVFAMGAVLVYALMGLPQISATEIPFVVVSVILAAVLQFMLAFMIGVSAFWVEDTSAFRWIEDKLIFIMGGMLIPINFFPDFLKSLALLLPFSYTSYAPAYMFVNFSIGFFVTTAGMQLLWIVVLAGVCLLLFSLGVRKVCINGG